MATVNPRTLVAKLNTHCRRALEAAAGLCLSRTNFHVEIEHWLVKLLEPADTDLTRLFKHYGIDVGTVTRELTRALDAMRTGNGRAPDLSLELLDLMREAWTLASLDYNAARLRSGHLLTALLTERSLALRMGASVPALSKLPAERLQQDLPAIIAGSAEDEAEPAPVTADGAPHPAAGTSRTPALDQYTLNLTERARKQQIDPVIGRDF